MRKKQSFADHLGELRVRLMVWLVFFVAGSVAGFLIRDTLLALLIKPLNEPLFYTSPVGGFNFVLEIALFFGLLLSSPILTYEIIKFCQPAMPKRIGSIALKLVALSYLLLAAGVAFAFWVAIPAAIHFLKEFDSDQIRALISTSEYFTFIIVYLAGLGIFFQLPVIFLLINFIKRLEVKKMMKWQGLAIVIAFVLAAIITPTPDPFNQSMVAIPLILLYELSILFVWLANKNIPKSA